MWRIHIIVSANGMLLLHAYKDLYNKHTHNVNITQAWLICHALHSYLLKGYRYHYLHSANS